MGPHQTAQYQILILADVPNDGRPDFAANIYNGHVPTFDELRANVCDVNFRSGVCDVTLRLKSTMPWRQHPYARSGLRWVYSASWGRRCRFEADYVYTAGRREEGDSNMNLGYNPATGANYPSTDISKRPFPEWGTVFGEFLEGWSNYHGLETAFTKRFSRRWQASAHVYAVGVAGCAAASISIRIRCQRCGRPGRRLTSHWLRIWAASTRSLPPTSVTGRPSTASGMPGTRFQLSGCISTGPGKRFSTSYGATCAVWASRTAARQGIAHHATPASGRHHRRAATTWSGFLSTELICGFSGVFDWPAARGVDGSAGGVQPASTARITDPI